MADTIKGPDIIHQERIINPPAVVRTAESLGISEKTAGNMLKVSGNVSRTCDNPKTKLEIVDTFNWSKEERQKLKENLLVQDLRKKLIAKYPEQRCYFETAIIKVMQLGENYKDYMEGQTDLGTDVFLLFSIDGKLLSYVDKDGNTLFDISSFNFDDDFANLLSKKKLNKYFRKNSQGKWELFINGEIFPEGSKRFNTVIANFHIYGKLLGNKSR